MHTTTSFHASAVEPEQLRGILAEFVALERAKVFRRRLVARFAVLTPIAAVVSILWLSASALWLSVGICVAVPTWAWTVELGHERRLARRLGAVPSATHVVAPADVDGERSKTRQRG